MKLTDEVPPHCSGCYGQKIGQRHVDLESAWDGPSFPEGIDTGDGGRVTNLTVAIDDLILCEECVEQAAKLVGLVRDDELREQAQELEEQNDNLRERLQGFADYTRNLEEAIASKPDLPGTPRVKEPVG